MAENLFLRLCRLEPGEAPQPKEPQLEWMLLDETSGIVRFKGQGSVAEFAALRDQLIFGGRTYVMIQGEDVLLTSAVVPSKQARQILQAVPYVIEEQLASDVELVREPIPVLSVLLS
jgi:type II secretory pathway component PulL